MSKEKTVPTSSAKAWKAYMVCHELISLLQSSPMSELDDACLAHRIDKLVKKIGRLPVWNFTLLRSSRSMLVSNLADCKAEGVIPDTIWVVMTLHAMSGAYNTLSEMRYDASPKPNSDSECAKLENARREGTELGYQAGLRAIWSELDYMQDNFDFRQAFRHVGFEDLPMFNDDDE